MNADLWLCPSCHRPCPVEGMCQTCGIFALRYESMPDAPPRGEMKALMERIDVLEALLDRIEQRAALSPLGFDSHADRKTLRLQGVMFAHWISEQRAEMVLAESRLTGQGGAEPPAARALLHTEAEAGA